MSDDFVDFGDPESFKNCITRTRVVVRFAIDLRNDDEVTVAEQLLEPFDILRFVLEIHFFGDDSREFFDDRPRGPNDVMVRKLFE